MSGSSSSAAEVSHGRLFILSLVIASFAINTAGILVTLMLKDIGLTFGYPVGVMGQISTASSVVAVVFALVMGFLSVRFRHKSLLLVGILSLNVSALGCALAPDFNSMLVSYALSGVALAMVSPMVYAMIGEYLPLEKRAGAISGVVAAGSFAFFIGAPVIALIAGYWGWRAVLPLFVIPVALAGLLMAFLGAPSKSVNTQHPTGRETYVESFKVVLSNRSAAACLVGDVLRSAQFAAILYYSISFFRDDKGFAISIEFATVILLIAALAYTLGSLASGWLVNRFGRKSSTILTALLAGVFTISYAYMSNLWLSFALVFIASWFSGMVTSAANTLALEQIPTFRGTMMSIDSAAANSGSALGAAVGGLALLSFGYEGLGLVLGMMGIIAAIVYYLLTTDPCKR